jgi:hypothetical protein
MYDNMSPNNIATGYWLDTGFGLVIGFTEILKPVTTNNSDSLTDLYTLQITTASTKSSVSSPVVAW